MTKNYLLVDNLIIFWLTKLLLANQLFEYSEFYFWIKLIYQFEKEFLMIKINNPIIMWDFILA